MLRPVASCLLLVAAIACAGCSDDDDGVPAASDPMPFVTLPEAESVIEQGMLAVVRTGGDADVGGLDGEPDVGDALRDAARYETQSGSEFDLFVFATADAARRATPLVVDPEDGESAVRAANLLAVFPQAFEGVDAYRAVARALRRLRVACDAGGRGGAELRRICFGEPAAVPPRGEGVDRDEAQDEEEPIVVDGLRYDPLIARRLNSRIVPDEEFASGRTPPAGKVWFGVFLRVCNRGERVRTSSERLALVDASGQLIEPSELPPGNAFAYEARSLAPGDCLPAKGSIAERRDGALVLFAVAPDVLRDTPVALDVEGRRVVLDV